MSLSKSILHGKEHRKPRYGKTAGDRWCHPPVRCASCLMKLRYKDKKRRMRGEGTR